MLIFSLIIVIFKRDGASSVRSLWMLFLSLHLHLLLLILMLVLVLVLLLLLIVAILLAVTLALGVFGLGSVVEGFMRR